MRTRVAAADGEYFGNISCIRRKEKHIFQLSGWVMWNYRNFACKAKKGASYITKHANDRKSGTIHSRQLRYMVRIREAQSSWDTLVNVIEGTCRTSTPCNKVPVHL